jgi:hypothetical protein
MAVGNTDSCFADHFSAARLHVKINARSLVAINVYNVRAAFEVVRKKGKSSLTGTINEGIKNEIG